MKLIISVIIATTASVVTAQMGGFCPTFEFPCDTDALKAKYPNAKVSFIDEVTADKVCLKRASIKCMRGHAFLDGSMKASLIYCDNESKGVWKGAPERDCMAGICPKPPEVHQANMSLSGVAYGNVVNYTCINGTTFFDGTTERQQKCVKNFQTGIALWSWEKGVWLKTGCSGNVTIYKGVAKPPHWYSSGVPNVDTTGKKLGLGLLLGLLVFAVVLDIITIRIHLPKCCGGGEEKDIHEIYQAHWARYNWGFIPRPHPFWGDYNQGDRIHTTVGHKYTAKQNHRGNYFVTD